MLKKAWNALSLPSLDEGWQRHRRVLWLGVLAGLILVSFAGNMQRGLLETTEGRYAECALEMISSGNYLEPTLDSKPHWTKPPMAYWAMAAGMAMVGPGEPSVRLGNAVAFICTGLVTAWMAWALWGEMSGWAALAIYATSVLPVLGGTILSTDILLTFFETLAVAFYFIWAHSPRQSRKLLAMMWAAFGLAFLTKGPPGLLPLLAIIPWHIWMFRDGRLFLPLGLALFLMPGLGYFAFIIAKHPDLFSYYLNQEIIGRLTSDTFHRNPQWWKPLVIYAPLLLLGQIHWGWMLRNPKKAWQTLPHAQRVFLGLWVVAPLAVFCVAKSRLPLYILPLSIPLTLFMAHGLVQQRSRIGLRTVAVTFVGTITLFVAARATLGVLPMHQNMRQLYTQVETAGDGEIVALVKDKAYGLQFYAGGMVKWIGSDGADREESLRQFLQTASGRYRLVAREKDESLLEKEFRAAGLTSSRSTHAGWIISAFEK